MFTLRLKLYCRSETEKNNLCPAALCIVKLTELPINQLSLAQTHMQIFPFY